MLSLDHRDARPVYEQVRDGMRTLIVTGALAPDDKLPSVRELAQQLAINPNTIQRAYRELEQDGFVYTAPGRGAFVEPGGAGAAKRREELLGQLDAIARELVLLGVSEEEVGRAVHRIYQEGEAR